MTDRKKLLEEFMNDPAEVHAVMHGIYAGLTEWKGTESMIGNPDVQKEPHYFKFGYVVGTLLRWSAIAFFGNRILG
ncbi:hypothetical protein B6U67_00790 [Methanosarcinales archaeon ex4484_138]|nr:MAG: hypothetical protein B6U67_00790 [Methanosarcinales archaeon ex4484_138]